MSGAPGPPRTAPPSRTLVGDPYAGHRSRKEAVCIAVTEGAEAVDQGARRNCETRRFVFFHACGSACRKALTYSPRSRPAADAWRVAAVDASNLRLAARNGGRRIPRLEHHSSASCRPLRTGEGAGSPFSPACAEKVRMRGREIIRGGQSPGPLTPALSPQAGRGGFRATRNFTLRQLPYGRGASCRRQ